jgi:multidrug efflux pump subunit AcrA (membrane-fusion protein)
MRAKRFFYSILLILFSLILAVDLAVWFLVPDDATVSKTETGVSFTPPEGAGLPEGITLPEGMSRPEGSGLPEGITLPEGMSRPESGDLPEGFTPPDGMAFPDREAGSEGSGRRSRRTGSTDETEAGVSLELPDWVPSQVLGFLPVAQRIRPYRLYILIGAVLGMALCILRLAFLAKKLRKLQESQEGEGAPLRRVALWPAVLLLLGALVLVVFLFPVKEEEKVETGAVANVRVLSSQVAEKTLTSVIQSAGSLEEQEAVSLEIPASVHISSVCVKNGDIVTAGQIVAKVDKTSVMQAIATLHEAMADVDEQLQEAHDTKGGARITAPVAGVVKAVYAEVGEKTIDVMNQYGALMLLSLDGRMAVQVQASESLTMGSAVTVTLPDGTELMGEVAYLEEGVATVTVVDRGYAVGTEVSVKNEEGVVLGGGSLYVNKALNITGYLGTITRVYRREGSTVNAGVSLFGVNDTADLAKYSALLRQREEYETELKTLFELYEDGYVHASCDGRIDGLDDTLAYLPLSDMAAGLIVRQLSGPADADPTEYHHYIGEVLSNNGNGNLSLRIHAQEVEISDYTALPSVATTVEGSYTVPGSAVYQFNGGWNRISVDDIWTGDKVLFTFDEEGKLMWVIVQRTSNSVEPEPTPDTPTPSDGPSGPGDHHGRISFGKSAPKSTPKPTYTIAKTELCAITPQERMLITVPVDELDVLFLSLGQEGDLYLDALPTLGLKAVVTKIDPEGVNSGGNTKYSVTLSLDRGPQLYPGMNGTVCFPRHEGVGVMTVPLAAVTEEGNRVIVYTAYDEENDQLLSPVEVRTGVSDGTDVEIVSGLKPGDACYYRFADAITYVTEEQPAQN